MKWLSTVVFVSVALVALTAQAASQQDAKVAFHVTSVSQGDATDYCTTGKCSATRITVEGYTQDKDAAVEYVLDCVEIITNEPTPHQSVQCVKVHSHADYMVTIGSDFILFDSDAPTKQNKEPYVSGYRIKSEKEVRKR